MAENSASKAAFLISAKGAVRTGTNADWPGGAITLTSSGSSADQSESQRSSVMSVSAAPGFC